MVCSSGRLGDGSAGGRYRQKDITWPSPWWTVAGISGLGGTTGAPSAARNALTSSSRWSQSWTRGRTSGVLAATLATTGAGRRCTTMFAPSASTTGSVLLTVNRAATVTAARTAASGMVGVTPGSMPEACACPWPGCDSARAAR